MQCPTMLPDLEARLGRVIASTCNVVGCDACSLKWPGGCSATELQGQIMDIEMAPYLQQPPTEAVP